MALLTLMRCKIHAASVTECDLHYEGSISIDTDILSKVGLIPLESVDVWNINSGARIRTYVIGAPPGSKTIGLNGAAARQFQKGDRIIIAAFALVDEAEAALHQAKIAIMSPENSIKEFVG